MASRRVEILDAALDVAQSAGIAAMSMRAVAQRVGVTVMALYRHVEGKEALLDGLVGRVLSEVQVPDAAQPWEQRLQSIGAEVLALARRYPSVVPLLLTRVYVAPEAVAVVTAMYAILRDAGVPEAQLPRVERLLSTFLLGYSVSAANHAFWSADATEPPTPNLTSTPPDRASPTGTESWTAELIADISDLTNLVRAFSPSRTGAPVRAEVGRRPTAAPPGPVHPEL